MSERRDLGSYLGTLMPQTVRPGHVILGAGIALAGMIGSAYTIWAIMQDKKPDIYKHTRKFVPPGPKVNVGFHSYLNLEPLTFMLPPGDVVCT